MSSQFLAWKGEGGILSSETFREMLTIQNVFLHEEKDQDYRVGYQNTRPDQLYAKLSVRGGDHSETVSDGVISAQYGDVLSGLLEVAS